MDRSTPPPPGPPPPRARPRGAPALRGRRAGETPMLVERSAWMTVATRAWPVALGVIALVALLAAQVTSTGATPAWSVAETLVAIVTIVLLARWAITDAYRWWFRLIIVTDQRVLLSQGGISTSLREIPLAAVQEVRIAEKSFAEWMFGFGRVTVIAAGGPPLTLGGVRAPRQVASLIADARAAHAPAQPPAFGYADDALRRVLDTLALPESMPAPQPLDPSVSARWPLSRAAHVPLAEGESLLGVVSRHWWALAEREIKPLAVLVAALLVLALGASLRLPVQVVGGAGVAVAAVWGLLAYLDFADDIFLMTSSRIIDVDRRLVVLFEASAAIEYDKIQEVKTVVPSLLARMLGFGDVTIAVGGESAPITMRGVSHPQAIEQSIEWGRAAACQRAGVAAVNQEKAGMKEWFAAVMGEMIASAPELRGMPLEQAIEHGQQVGLRVVLFGDGVQIPGWPAGYVVSQSPMPGARALRGGDIIVVLSRM